MDGTSQINKKEITFRNRETLIRAQQEGVLLVLASGHPTHGIAPLANELQMEQFGGFILSYNGGEIIDWKSKELLHAKVLPMIQFAGMSIAMDNAQEAVKKAAGYITLTNEEDGVAEAVEKFFL